MGLITLQRLAWVLDVRPVLVRCILRPIFFWRYLMNRWDIWFWDRHNGFWSGDMLKINVQGDVCAEYQLFYMLQPAAQTVSLKLIVTCRICRMCVVKAKAHIFFFLSFFLPWSDLFLTTVGIEGYCRMWTHTLTHTRCSYSLSVGDLPYAVCSQVFLMVVIWKYNMFSTAVNCTPFHQMLFSSVYTPLQNNWGKQLLLLVVCVRPRGRKATSRGQIFVKLFCLIFLQNFVDTFWFWSTSGKNNGRFTCWFTYIQDLSPWLISIWHIVYSVSCTVRPKKYLNIKHA